MNLSVLPAGEPSNLSAGRQARRRQHVAQFMAPTRFKKEMVTLHELG